MKKGYDSLVDAINDLKMLGYDKDFNLQKSFLECKEPHHQIAPEEFTVDGYYRFDGNTNPSDESVLYAISSKRYQLKGILIDAYGAYSEPPSAEMLQKLRFTP
ncbi:phosphoribosylpyrophosphate synthetase [Aggregatimonas sangjinii]|uniref:Phosphoribosylpyrophosphate synthetase n=1 Tax=Aggregatimonas sangjinii TaxID=2583587 RepID=A0A5B7SR37_9FLAO|nr:phosphoribosylpyrophosphate synthetase [Aggregatimonas sangjinii]QCW99472.1 phosphoribosylpyrophosphate synthetase [Aggregatimonas sangjinii]